MPKADLLNKINKGLVNPLSENDIFVDEIKISYLKKIDKVFCKGLMFFLDPKNIEASKEESIFFRKDHFNADLNFGARQIVQKFEEEKLSISTLAKLADLKIKRSIPVYKISDNPQLVANEVKNRLYPIFTSTKKDFLTNFINKLAENNILVFEFVETHNKIEKANINGFYLTPNVIVLKRNQKSLKREIFTLAHELGHYLLNEEEIDNNINEESESVSNLGHIERWCNDFAFYFLAGKYANVIADLPFASVENDYHTDEIENISSKTNLSTLAIFTRLLLSKKIASLDYHRISGNILRSIKDWEIKEKERIEAEKQKAIEEGRKPGGATPKPIISPLFLTTLQISLYNGLINEAEFCKKLNIKPDKIEKYLL